MAFFQGTLQEGIAAALQQSKSVMCFVTDGKDESQTWELQYLLDEALRPMLESNAVSLRLEAGSQEEGFLKQLYPVPQKPTVVIIRDGQLKEYIAAGASREDFLRRMKAALTTTELTPDQPLPSQAAPPQPAATPAATPAAIPAPASLPNQPSHADESSSSSSGQATPPSTTNSRVQSMLTARAARVLEQKKKDEAEAKRQGAEKGKAKAEAGASVPKKTDEQSKHAAALKKKQREAREERERILKAIEDDKVARKVQKEEVAAARRLSMASEKPDLASFAPITQVLSSAGRLSEHCAIQARLFDGSTIRNRFSSSDTLSHVRKWVDENRGDNKEAYCFKVLLTPLPSKTIDVTEEDKSLQELELTPSSTLILLRVPKFRVAYSTSPRPAAGVPQGNIFQRLIAFFLAIITGFFSTVTAFFSTLLSTAGPSATPEASTSRATGSQSQAAADAARRRAGRIAGVDHTDGRRNDQQFYNGNSTNFEPRSDDGE